MAKNKNTKTLFHGTTKSNLDRIYKCEGKGVNPWRLGDSDKMYFVDLSKPISYGPKIYRNLTQDDIDNAGPVDRDKAIKKAFNQACLQACFSEDIDLYVLECEIPDEIIEPDRSFEDALDSQIDISNFDLGFVTKIHHIVINKYCKPEYVIGMWENGSCNKEAIPEDLKDYVSKVIMVSDKEEKPRHILSREVIDFDVWSTEKPSKYFGVGSA